MKKSKFGHIPTSYWQSFLRSSRASVVVLVILGVKFACFFQVRADEPSVKAVDEAEFDLAAVTWKRSGIRFEGTLKFLPDGKFVMRHTRFLATANDPDFLADSIGTAGTAFSPDGDEGPKPETGDVLPKTAFVIEEKTTETKGSWRVLHKDLQLIELKDDEDGVRGARLYQIDGDEDRWRYEPVYLLERKEAHRDGLYTREGWLKVAEGWVAELGSLVPFTGEVAIDKFPAGAAKSLVMKNGIPGDTVKRLKAVLPGNWDLGVCGNYIVLTYKKQVQGETNAPSAPGEPGGADAWNDIWERRVQLFLRVEPRLALQDWKERHKSLSEELTEMASQMEEFKDAPRTKPSLYGYSPENEKQRAMLMAYADLRKDASAMPDFFDDDCAVEVSSSLGPYDYLLERDVTKSLDAMKTVVEAAFRRYDE